MYVRKSKMRNKTTSRKKQILYNIWASMLSQILAVIANLILPRYFLSYFGSETNGLISSITQFLGYIALLDLGVGAVFQSALYKPLAQKNEKEINNVFCSGKEFYNKIGIVIAVYILILAVVYPYIVIDSFDYSVCSCVYKRNIRRKLFCSGIWLMLYPYSPRQLVLYGSIRLQVIT